MSTRQPNSRFCFVCGVKNPVGLKMVFEQTGPGEVSAVITVPEHFEGYPGVVHGGITAAMLDEAACRVYMNEDPPRFLFTARLEIRYRKNVPTQTPLRLVGKALKDRGRTVTAHSALYLEDGTLLAEGEALMVDVPEEMSRDADLDAVGWRVYSDEELASATSKQS
ncbi:MAG: PaaI family thioesterase [Chloroflexi bacterium]|nr:PaaI family thioesterase [Chloroflexota bacterium]